MIFITPYVDIEPTTGSPRARLAGPVLIDRHGDVTVRGTLRIKGGDSPRTIVYRPTTDPAPAASCNDTDGDGNTGVTGLTIWYASRSGALVAADFQIIGEINQRGRYETDVEIRGAGRASITTGVILIVR